MYSYLADYLILFSLSFFSSLFIYGFGLCLLGKTVDSKTLLTASFAAAFIIGGILSAPVSHGAKLYLAIFVLMFFLYKLTTYPIFICAGAVSLGFSIQLSVGYTLGFVALEYGLDWPLFPVGAIPPAFVGALLALFVLIRLEKRPLLKNYFQIDSITDNELLRILRIVPPIQLFSALLVTGILLILPSNSILHWYLPLILFSLILLSFWYASNTRFKRPTRLTPIDYVDLLILFPAVIYIIHHSGGPASPWYILFIPLVIANSSKSSAFFGVISVTTAVVTMVYFSVAMPGLRGPWHFQNIIFLAVIFIFVSLSTRHYAVVERNHAQKKEAERHKLAANIIHDFGTPSTLVKGYTEMLVEKVDPYSQIGEDYLKLILTRIKGLERLALDLQDLADLESGEAEFRIKIVNLQSYMEQIIIAYEKVARDRGINLTLYNLFAESPEFTFEIDVELLNRVFSNLIDNAINHTSRGGMIEITCSPGRTKKEVLIAVTDTGVGISEKDLPQIFNRFYTGEKHSSSKQGSGLGLAIVKDIVRQHGGQIWVDSEVGRGSSFYFTIPVNKTAAVFSSSSSFPESITGNTAFYAQLAALLIIGGAFIALSDSFPATQGWNFIFLLAVGLMAGVTAVKTNSVMIKRKLLPYFDLTVMVFLFSIAYLLVFHTGGAASQWHMLFIPLVMASSLKREKIYGLTTVIAVGAGLLFLVLSDWSSHLSWHIEQNIAYLSFLAVTYWITRYFIGVERNLNRASAEMRISLMAQTADDLQLKLNSIKADLEVMQPGNKVGKENKGNRMRQVSRKLNDLNCLIKTINELLQVQSSRALYLQSLIDFEELIVCCKNDKTTKPGQGNNAIHIIELAKADDSNRSAAAATLQVRGDYGRLADSIANLARHAVGYGGNAIITYYKNHAEKVVQVRIKPIRHPSNTYIDGESKMGSDAAARMKIRIAEIVIKEHGGRFQVVKKPGCPGGFYFTLPLTESTEH